MTVIVIEFDRADNDALFGDERLETLQYLLTQGCYGALIRSDDEPEGVNLRRILAPDPANARAVEIATPSAMADGFADAAELVSTGAAEYLHVLIPSLTSADLPVADAALSSLLARLGADAVLAVLASAPQNGAYLLVAKDNPLSGSSRPATVFDLSLTILALAGLPRPDGTRGEVLFFAEDGARRDEDAELRERFRGLGYIA